MDVLIATSDLPQTSHTFLVLSPVSIPEHCTRARNENVTVAWTYIMWTIFYRNIIYELDSFFMFFSAVTDNHLRTGVNSMFLFCGLQVMKLWSASFAGNMRIGLFSGPSILFNNLLLRLTCIVLPCFATPSCSLHHCWPVGALEFY